MAVPPDCGDLDHAVEHDGGGASLEVIRMLHSSGRITRQEAASMIPVELMAPFEDDLVLGLVCRTLVEGHADRFFGNRWTKSRHRQ